jgi:hypothetical protein
MASQCISKLARLRPPSASLSLLNVGLELHVHTGIITPSKCISEFTHSGSPISKMYFSPSAKNISVRAEWLRHSGGTPSEPTETPRWWITPCPAAIPRVALHIDPRSPGNCDHTSERVYWVYTCIGIAMGDAAKISPRVPSTLSPRSIGRR